MIIIILLTHTALILAGLMFLVTESRRRRETELALFRELRQAIELIDEDLDKKEKLLKGWNFLMKRTKFHKWLIDGVTKEMRVQDNNFSKFGGFIAMIAESLPMPDPEAKHTHKQRIENLVHSFWEAPQT